MSESGDCFYTFTYYQDDQDVTEVGAQDLYHTLEDVYEGILEHACEGLDDEDINRYKRELKYNFHDWRVFRLFNGGGGYYEVHTVDVQPKGYKYDVPFVPLRDDETDDSSDEEMKEEEEEGGEPQDQEDYMETDAELEEIKTNLVGLLEDAKTVTLDK